MNMCNFLGISQDHGICDAFLRLNVGGSMARQRLECGDLSPRFPGGSARPRFMRWRTANAGARSKPSTLNLQLSTAVAPGCAALRDFPATDRRALPAALQLFPQTEGLP